MLEFMKDIKVGSKILVKKGKYGRKIAYNCMGKVIIITNKIRLGFAEVTEVIKVKDNCTVVRAKNIVDDYYDGIGYQEFIDVLQLKGYIIAFERPFEYNNNQEKQILAYNIEYGTILVALTWNNCKDFTDTEIYAPINGLRKFMRESMVTQASSTQTVFNMEFSKVDCPISYIHSFVDTNTWNERDDICLWTYADKEPDLIPLNKWGSNRSTLWSNTIDRILLADEGIETILGNSKSLKPVFDSRKEVEEC